MVNVGTVCSHPAAAPVVATSDHARLGGREEYRLRNPLREICTAGSVRGEIPGKPRWTYSGTKLETADTAKESLQLPGLLYSEERQMIFMCHLDVGRN